MIMIKLFIAVLFLALPALASDSYRITLPNGLKIDAEVAKDKQKGLQDREELCDTCGMIFIFEEEGFHQFWMNETFINLAMIWIKSDGKIAHIVENAEPCTGKENPSAECEIFTPASPAKYVLEVNPEAAKGLETGTKLESNPPLWK